MSHDFASQGSSAPFEPAPPHFSQPSMADPALQQSRPQQPGAYPSPHSYPSPSMQSNYAYPPAQGPPPTESYRGSPQNSNMSLPPLNLPPIRLQDGQQPPPPQPQQSQQPMGSPLPPPQHGMPQYYQHPPPHAQPGQPMNMGAMGPSQFNGMRYQLPPQGDPRVLSGGRHKKEIKRRTKTGCLTCRKRRIKCDEAHPMCRNCQKSKRECLGYDPIFKQQSGPAQIQPAPNALPVQHAASAPSAPAQQAPPSYSQSPVPQGYAPASSAPAGYAPAASTSSASHPQENFNPIDPALAPTGPPMHPNQPPYNGAHPVDPAMRGAPNSYSVAPPPAPLRGKRLNIAAIYGICNHEPPQVPQRPDGVPKELDDQFTTIFLNDYCQGLDMMLQTNWFSSNSNALKRVFSDRALHEEAAFFAECVKIKMESGDMNGVFSQEARLIWHLLGTCRYSLPKSNGTDGSSSSSAPPESDELAVREARARLDVLEALLTNQNLETNPLRHISYVGELHEYKRAENDFWLYLGDFVQFSDADHAPQGAADHALANMRNVLQMLEVRDAIYSIAIARHLGSRTGGFPNALPPSTPAPESELDKLLVAMSFISHESRSASQQVLARVCDMAMLSWTVSRAP